ncbi:MAG: beta-lactamase domain protein [Candidatus Solibacter sp.]|jgi:cyclase|nr:beta-lactamase domain protein [Candidatus Solibacter sp.]
MAAAAFFTTRTQAGAGEIKLIAPGVWFREGDLQNLGHSNNIIIEMKDYLIVVDANFPSGARLTMEAAKRISDKPVKYVFDTHHHGDHAYGNSVWTKAGATTLAYIGVTEEMKRFEPNRWQAAAKSRPDVGDLHEPAPEPPTQTFDKSPFVLKDGSREVRFYFYGWAHTRGDGFVYLPKEKVLCTGDAVVNGPYNYTADANIGNWPKVVRSAQTLTVEHVLPGHGPSGGPELLDGQARFMTELHKAVEVAIKSGRKLEEVAPKVVPATTTITLPNNVKNWVGPSLPGQVRDTWEEITQKTPHGDIPH